MNPFHPLISNVSAKDQRRQDVISRVFVDSSFELWRHKSCILDEIFILGNLPWTQIRTLDRLVIGLRFPTYWIVLGNTLYQILGQILPVELFSVLMEYNIQTREDLRELFPPTESFPEIKFFELPKWSQLIRFTGTTEENVDKERSISFISAPLYDSISNNIRDCSRLASQMDSRSCCIYLLSEMRKAHFLYIVDPRYCYIFAFPDAHQYEIDELFRKYPSQDEFFLERLLDGLTDTDTFTTVLLSVLSQVLRRGGKFDSSLRKELVRKTLNLRSIPVARLLLDYDGKFFSLCSPTEIVYS